MMQKNMAEPLSLMIGSAKKLNLENNKIYADYLAQTYYYVCHSTRFLALSAGLMPKEEEKYFTRFIKHISEEKSHEVLAQRDLKQLGFEVTDFSHKPETRMLWESQYYKILREDPLIHLGYILILEQFASSYLSEMLNRLEKVYGKKAQSFLRLHADEDQDHVDKAIKQVESLSKERQLKIIQNMHQTALAYSQMMNACDTNTQPQPSSFVETHI